MKKKSQRTEAMAAPKPPTPEERVDRSAESLARDLTEAHPEVKRIRTDIEKKLRGAMHGVVRGVNGHGGRVKKTRRGRRR